MARPTFEYSAHLPPAYAALLWDTFFTQRGRGLSLTAHLPWMDTPAPGLAFATLSEGDTLLAGLTVRPCGDLTAAVGLVCVRADQRGKGLSRMLLEQALTCVDEGGFNATTLWTGKPRVYESQGFRALDESLLCDVRDLPPREAAVQARSWPDAQEVGSKDRGLPPYALHGLRFCSDRAAALVVQDPLGVSVAEWQGSDDAVVALLRAVMPARWRLQALGSDTLPQALAANGATLNITPQALQMWRARPGQPLPPLPPLRLLDRI